MGIREGAAALPLVRHLLLRGCMAAALKLIESPPPPATAAPLRQPAVPVQPAAIPSALSFRARMGAEDASAYLNLVWAIRRTPKTLAKLRCVGGGPAFQKAGRDVIYTRVALDGWALGIMRDGQP